MKRLAFFDIDETLWIARNHFIPASLSKALRLLKAADFDLVVASGRPYDAIDPEIRELGFDYYIANNGASAFDSAGEELYSIGLSAKDKQAISCFAQKEKRGLLFKYGSGAEHICYPEQFLAFNESYGLNGKVDIVTYDGDPNDSPLAGTIRLEKDEIALMAERFPDLEFISTNIGGFYDFNRKGIHKGFGVRTLGEKLAIDPKKCLAFGDNYNDIEMLEEVGYSVAMGNGVDALKNIAYYVTERLENDGIYQAVSVLLKELNGKD